MDFFHCSVLFYFENNNLLSKKPKPISLVLIFVDVFQVTEMVESRLNDRSSLQLEGCLNTICDPLSRLKRALDHLEVLRDLPNKLNILRAILQELDAQLAEVLLPNQYVIIALAHNLTAFFKPQTKLYLLVLVLWVVSNVKSFMFLYFRMLKFNEVFCGSAVPADVLAARLTRYNAVFFVVAAHIALYVVLKPAVASLHRVALAVHDQLAIVAAFKTNLKLFALFTDASVAWVLLL